MVSFFQQEYARHTNFAIAECKVSPKKRNTARWTVLTLSQVETASVTQWGGNGCIELPRLGDMVRLHSALLASFWTCLTRRV